MMQTRRVGDATITRILEYAAPTHDPAFLFPELPQAELDRLAPTLAPHHYIPAMNRLIVTIQLWIVHAGSNVILIDTGVGNFKPRAAARMNMLNTLTLPWLEAAGAAPKAVTHVVQTHMHSDHVGWNTVLADGRWVPTFPNARYLMPRGDFDYYRDEAAQRVNPTPASSISLATTAKSPAASTSSRHRATAPACSPTGCARRARKPSSVPTCCTARRRSPGPS